MKPLSALNYVRNNKKSFIATVISIALSVLLIYSLNIIFNLPNKNFDLVEFEVLKRCSIITPPEDSSEIPKKVINKFEKDNNVEKIISAQMQRNEFQIPMFNKYTYYFGVKESDVNYLTKKLEVRLKMGRLPKENKNEIALDYRLAKNKGYKLNQLIGSDLDKSEELHGKYKIVGILDGKCAIGIISYKVNNSNSVSTPSQIVFHKKHKLQYINSQLKSLPSSDLNYEAYNKVYKDLYGFLRNIDNVFNSIVVMTIIVIAITISTSTYIHFIQRQKEFGVLGALGYKKSNILKKAFIEISMINIIGLLLGIAGGFIVGILLKEFYFLPKGITVELFVLKGILESLFVPSITILATIVPINMMIEKIDPITIIEGGA